MRTLREVLEEAERRKAGVGHFKLLPAALEAMKDVIRARLGLFSHGEKWSSA